MSEREDAGRAIGEGAARLAWDYAAAMARVNGDPDLVVLHLPHGWITLAARVAQLLVVEALRQAEDQARADDGRAELRELCVHCGYPNFAVYASPCGAGFEIACLRCGRVAHYV